MDPPTIRDRESQPPLTIDRESTMINQPKPKLDRVSNINNININKPKLDRESKPLNNNKINALEELYLKDNKPFNKANKLFHRENNQYIATEESESNDKTPLELLRAKVRNRRKLERAKRRQQNMRKLKLSFDKNKKEKETILSNKKYEIKNHNQSETDTNSDNKGSYPPRKEQSKRRRKKLSLKQLTTKIVRDNLIILHEKGLDYLKNKIQSDNETIYTDEELMNQMYTKEEHNTMNETLAKYQTTKEKISKLNIELDKQKQALAKHKNNNIPSNKFEKRKKKRDNRNIKQKQRQFSLQQAKNKTTLKHSTEKELEKEIKSKVKHKTNQENIIKIVHQSIERVGLKYTIKLMTLLIRYSDSMAKSKFDIGRIPNIEFKLELKNPGTTINFKPYNHPVYIEKEITRIVENLLEKGLIDEYTGEYASPVILVVNSDGSTRLCNDYTYLNSQTKDMTFPCPSVDEKINKFAGKSIYTTFDIVKAFHNIPVEEQTQNLLAFTCKRGTFKWKVTPFGPKQSPPYWAKAVNMIYGKIEDLIGYIDDLVIASENIDKHLISIHTFFEKTIENNLKLKLSKCDFFSKKIKFIGHEVSPDGIKPQQKYIQKLIKFKRPETYDETKRYCGMVTWLNRYIFRLSIHAKPIYDILKGKRKQTKTNIEWNEKLEKAFQHVQNLVYQSGKQILGHPDLNRPFYIYTDASKYGYGAVLFQRKLGKDIKETKNEINIKEEKYIKTNYSEYIPIEFFSRKFNDTQIRWHITTKELFSFKEAINKWNNYLFKKFYVYSDSKNILHMYKRQELGKINAVHTRWLLLLRDKQFVVKFVKGIENVVADYLSRDNQIFDKPIITKNHATEKLSTRKITKYKNRKLLLEKHINDTKPIDHMEYVNFIKQIQPIEKTLTQPKYFSEIENNEYKQQIHQIRQDYKLFRFKNKKVTSVLPKTVQSLSDIEDNSFGMKKVNNTNIKINKINAFKASKIIKDDNDNGTRHDGDTLFGTTNREILYPIQTRSQSKANQNHHSSSEKQLKNKKKKGRIHVTKSKKSKPNDKEESNEEFDIERYNEDRRDNFDLERYYNDPIYTLELLSDKEYIQNEQIFDNRKIKYNQLRDPILKIIINYLKNRNKREIDTLPPKIIHDIKAEKYKLIGILELLMYKSNNGNVIVLPTQHRKAIMTYLHFSFNGIHNSRDYMAEQIRRRFYWPGYIKDIVHFIEYCHTCQLKNAKLHPNRGESHIFTPRSINIIWVIDHAGPLPTTPDGHEYITSIGDMFSGKIYAYPRRNIRADGTAKLIFNLGLQRGFPEYLLSDQGQDLIGEIIQHLTSILGIHKLKTTSYHPQCNGMIEHWNCIMKRCIRTIGIQKDLDFEDTTPWNIYLDYICAYHNNTYSRRSGLSPNQIENGKNIILPIDFKTNINQLNINTIEKETYKNYMQHLQQINQALVRKNLQKYNKKKKLYYDKRHTIYTYEVGEHVLWLPAEYKDKSGGIFNNWKGVYKILDTFNEGTNYKIVLTDWKTGKVILNSKGKPRDERVVNVKRIHPYKKPKLDKHGKQKSHTKSKRSKRRSRSRNKPNNNNENTNSNSNCNTNNNNSNRNTNSNNIQFKPINIDNEIIIEQDNNPPQEVINEIPPLIPYEHPLDKIPRNININSPPKFNKIPALEQPRITKTNKRKFSELYEEEEDMDYKPIYPQYKKQKQNEIKRKRGQKRKLTVVEDFIPTRQKRKKKKTNRKSLKRSRATYESHQFEKTKEEDNAHTTIENKNNNSNLPIANNRNIKRRKINTHTEDITPTAKQIPLLDQRIVNADTQSGNNDPITINEEKDQPNINTDQTKTFKDYLPKLN